VPATPTAQFEQSQAETATDTAEETEGDDPVQLVSLDQTPPTPEEPNPSASPATHPIADPLFGSEILDVESLIAAVLSSNPSMQAATAAWAATAERYPQQVALNDPVLQTMFAPGTYSSNSATQPSYYLGFAQEIPWHGKRQLKGQIAAWETQAAAWDSHEVRLRLSNAARLAYFDYYLVQRELELNARNLQVTQDARSSAKSKYEANQVSQQDLSLADLELATLKQERVELLRSEKIATARINTLLHRHPDHPLPVSVQQLTVNSGEVDPLRLYDVAAAHRPELSAIAARIQSEQAAVALACKEYYPDFEVMGRYDQFWTDRVQRGQLGVNMNIPLNQGRRDAAVREAQFRVAKLNAEYAQKQDSINEEVRVAASELEASLESVAIYENDILPAATRNLDAAQAAYIAGSVDFLSLMEARRQFITRQVAYHRVLTEFHRSQANLELAIGMPISEVVWPSDPTPAVEN
jgi:outer membrane protein TolC